MAIDPALAQRFAAIPIFDTLALRLERADREAAVLTMPYRKAYDGIFESFHGGLLMTLADTCACIALLAHIGADARVTTTDMNIRFLAGCYSNATATAKLIKLGKTLAPANVDLHDASGTLVAVAQVTYMRLPPR
ncbi:MAG: PaaI family thioesterase [Terriglobales bacterium]